MEVKVLEECGYRWAALGFSLSYNTSIERAMEIMPKYAFKNNGENKFLRAIHIWFDIDSPRNWLTEFDTYKIATVRLSESTMHTLCKRPAEQDDFEYPVADVVLDNLNSKIEDYKNKRCGIERVKNDLPEGYLQRIVYECNYATLQNMYLQRKSHKLPQWQILLDSVLSQIEHPEFIVPKKEA